MEGSTLTGVTKKILSAGLIVCLVASISGCEELTPHENLSHLPTVTLALRSGIYADVIKSCIPKFEEEHGIFCEVLELSEDDLHNKIYEDAVNEKGAYDLCMVDGSWIAQYTAHDVLTDLTELGYDLDDDIISETKKICYHDGDVYLAPYYGNVTVLLYNKALIEEAGYRPDTIKSLQDMYDICMKINATHNYGFMYRGDTTNNIVVDFLPILLSFGGWVVDENNHPTVDTDEFRQAMEFYLKLTETGQPAQKDEMIMAIANKAAAMGIGWPGWYTPDDKSTADYLALSGRVADDSKAYNANVYGVWTIAIPSNSTKKEKAVELLTYLMDPEVQKQTIPSGGVPCRYSSLRDPAILEKYPQYEEVCDALEGGVYRPIMEEWSDFYQILGTEMKEIMEGRKDVAEGLSDAQERLEDMLDNE